MAAQAARCTCFFAPEGTLTFAEIVLGASVETVGHDVMEQPANVSVSERINTIELSTRDEYAETEELFTASDIKEDESIQVMSIDNPLAAAGDEVAAWLLGMYQRRVSYDFLERGNPARDVGDTITVQDVYGENRGANVIKMQLSFDGKLASQTQALGGAGL